MIGATTNEEYRKYIETDPAFSRRFEVVRLEEPDEPTALRMIEYLRELYESHYQLTLEPGAISGAVHLAKRYVNERRLPDAAIDLIDRTLSAVRVMRETSGEVVAQLKEEWAALPTEGSISELNWFHRQMVSRINPILFGQLETTGRPAAPSDYPERKIHLKNQLEALETLSEIEKESVGEADIAAIVSRKTGIPLGKLQREEQEKLMHLEDQLRKRVIGQDEALGVVADAIRESRADLNKPGAPIGSFFFLGPTGTGKTELAKTLAELLFDDEKALIRFDMSEFKEPHAAALLYGAPPGYVGYQEGGLLVNKIRQQPYAVVLFDEIEKAHASVFDIFLQILDEGKLSDKLGRQGDFSNAVILFTSNIGSEFIVERHGQGALPSSKELKERMKGHFRDEFLGRVTEMIPFSPITEEMAMRIFGMQCRQLTDTLREQGIELEIAEAAEKQLVLSGFSSEFGARPLKDVIRRELRRPLSRRIISGELREGASVRLEVDEAEELVWTILS